MKAVGMQSIWGCMGRESSINGANLWGGFPKGK